MASNPQVNFYMLYQELREGVANYSSGTLTAWFGDLADRLLLDFHPNSVLDVSCSAGLLVKALRERGIEAWGVDRSSEIIHRVPDETQPFCQAGSVLEPFRRPHYDLIVSIGSPGQLSPEDDLLAVKNLAEHSDDILFTCQPFGSASDTGSKPPEYWAGLFDQCGCIHDLDYEANFIDPWAMRFIKTSLPLQERIALYERKIWQLAQEASLRRELNVEYKNELAEREMDLHYWMEAPKRLEAELEVIRRSTSWRIITQAQHARERIIPLGSRRETLMRNFMRGVKAFRREGILGFPVFVYHKLRETLSQKTSRFWLSQKLRRTAQPGIGEVCQIDGVSDRPKIEPHNSSVDIVVCVHNALDDVQRCLDSLLEHTSQPYRLILVDDGSGEPAAQYLRIFAGQHGSLLLRSDSATGYPRAANRGMQASTAEFVVLLNSDVILTPQWLDRLVSCIEGDPQNGMVGPLANTASWQSVPKIEQNGDWASNPLPQGVSAADMARMIAATSARLYAEMPLLNGFCLLIRHKLLDQVGVFDEINFSQGYGEEDDLVLRARKAGWKMALADDVYIYHAQSKSYSSDKRHALSDRAQKTLREKHGEQIISQGVHFCQDDPVLEGIRARAQAVIERRSSIDEGKKFAGKNLLFVFHIVYSPTGGTNVIRSESLALQQMGVKTVYFHPQEHKESYIEAYPDLALSSIYGEPSELELAAQNFDAVIATYNPTVEWLRPLGEHGKYPVLGYYIQGFEPLMYEPGSARAKNALDSYSLVEDMVLVTKTDWTAELVRQAAGRGCTVVGPSVDIDLYRPRPRREPVWPAGPLKITAMIRPESPYREPLKTMLLLQRTVQKYRGEVEISLFGTSATDPGFKELPHDFPWKLYGVLSPAQVANLFSQSDIFIDYSSHQAMGLAAMEAMACGCAVIVPEHGGVSSYAIHEQNSLMVDSASHEAMWAALQRLIDDEKLRDHIRRNAIHDICRFYPERAALNMLKALFPGENA